MDYFLESLNLKFLYQFSLGILNHFFKYIDKFTFLSQGEYEYALKHFPKYKNKYFLLPFLQLIWKFEQQRKFSKRKNILFVGNDGFRDYELAEELSKLLEDFNFVYVSENINESNLNNKKFRHKKW